MTVSTLSLPNFTQNDAATYKTNIDATLAAHNGVAGGLAPSAMTSPAMAVMFQPATLPDGTVIAAQSLSGIGAPSAHPRIDRLYLDLNDRQIKRAVGAEADSAVAPSIPLGSYPIASVRLTVGMTAITNSDIVDDRPSCSSTACEIRGDGYTSIVDPDGLMRVSVGKTASDPRIVVKLHTAGTLEIQDSNGAKIGVIDDKGNLSIAGKLTENATL